jgi:hypothetical protein
MGLGRKIPDEGELMNAVLHALLTITSEPVELVKKDGSPVCTVKAREADDQGKGATVFQLFGLSEKSRRTIAGLGQGDTVSVRGPIAVRVEPGGAAVIQVNAVDFSMQLPITPKTKPRAPKPPKPGRCGGGTRRATHAGVEAANAAYAARKASS